MMLKVMLKMARKLKMIQTRMNQAKIKNNN
jgi:hypothetical protein